MLPARRPVGADVTSRTDPGEPIVPDHTGRLSITSGMDAPFGEVRQIGVEGTGAYGAGLTRFLVSEGVKVVEVNRPDRQRRRRRGKSDTTDAEAAARAVLSGDAAVVPKTGGGQVEGLRALRIARRSARKARTQTALQIRDLVLTAPNTLRTNSNLSQRRSGPSAVPGSDAATQPIRSRPSNGPFASLVGATITSASNSPS